MPPLLQIEEPQPIQPPTASKKSGQPFLSMGFRPLYLAGTAWAIIAIVLWIWLPPTRAPLSGLAWHAHEMLWGFVVTIAVGFLLTAGANWTGHNPLEGRTLLMLCLCWLTARIGYLVPQLWVFRIAAVAETIFLLGAAHALARVVTLSRNWRNAGLPFLLAALALANGAYLYSALHEDTSVLLKRLDTGLLCMALLALIIARRVIPFFAMRALPGLDLPLALGSGRVQVAAGLLAVVASLFSLHGISAPALAVCGLLALWHCAQWQPLAVRGKPLLWILYAGYAGLALGLLAAAAHHADLLGTGRWPAHLIGMGGFALLIIGMVTRTALGHLGRPLQTDRSMVSSFALCLLALLLRLAALLPTAAASFFLQGAALAWTLAFALYLWRFAPMLLQPVQKPAALVTPVAFMRRRHD